MEITKEQVVKALDLIDTRNDQVRRVGSKLEALSPGGKVDYSFMLVFDKDKKFTGNYVREIGWEWDRRWEEVKEGLSDAKGDPLVYITHDNKEDYTPEDLEHNKKLTIAKRKYGKFMAAEEKVNGELVDGEFMRYSKEFKTAREQVAVWISQGKYGYWKKKASVSSKRYREFKTKYYTSNRKTD